MKSDKIYKIKFIDGEFEYFYVGLPFVGSRKSAQIDSDVYKKDQRRENPQSLSERSPKNKHISKKARERRDFEKSKLENLLKEESEEQKIYFSELSLQR